jgi:hypothetical protein
VKDQRVSGFWRRAFRQGAEVLGMLPKTSQLLRLSVWACEIYVGSVALALRRSMVDAARERHGAWGHLK